MNRLISIALIGFLAWYGWGKYQEHAAEAANRSDSGDQLVESSFAASSELSEQPSSAFRCDGRTHCSQMTSCAEATFFLRNCPNTQMDGNNDGQPCERQWCH